MDSKDDEMDINNEIDNNHINNETHSKIKLEILSQRGVNFLLFITYATVAFAVGFGSVEENLRFNTAIKSGKLCKNNLVENSDCTRRIITSTSNSSLWNGYIEFEQLELYFSLGVIVRRKNNVNIDINEKIIYDVKLYGDYRSERKLIYQSLGNEGVLYCSHGHSDCYLIPLLIESQYEYSLVREYRSFNVSIEYHNLDLLDYGQVDYYFYYHNKHFKIMELTMHVILLCITLAVIMIWLNMLWKRKYERTLKEQIWISCLLIVLFFLQNPFFVPLSVHPTKDFYLMSSSTEILAVGAMLCFWLLLIDSLSYRDANISSVSSDLAPDEQLASYLDTILREPTTFSQKQFYFPKILFLLLFTISTQGLVFSSRNIIYELQTTSLTLEVVESNIVTIIFAIVACISLLAWIVLFIRSFIRTSRSLATQNYILTRFKQLSFRFFILQSVLVMIYFCLFSVFRLVRYYHTSQSISIYSESFASFILTSCYIYILAYIYIPADTKFSFRPIERIYEVLTSVSHIEHDIISQFSLEIAYTLCLFSYQCYFDIPNMKHYGGNITSKSKWGELDAITQMNANIVAQFYSNETESQAYIAVLHDTIVVAFRGTATKKNLMIDLKFGSTPLPTNFLSFMDISTFGGNPKVHSGFYSSYSSLRIQINEKINQMTAERPNFFTKLQLTGHSMGAACAFLCALDLSQSEARKVDNLEISVYTFGAPRLGNRAFKNIYDKFVPRTFRVRCDRDFVTTIPNALCLYKHIGIEIILDKIGNYICAPLYVEKIFRASRNSLEDHKMKYYLNGLRLACYRNLSASSWVHKLKIPQPEHSTEQKLENDSLDIEDIEQINPDSDSHSCLPSITDVVNNAYRELVAKPDDTIANIEREASEHSLLTRSYGSADDVDLNLFNK